MKDFLGNDLFEGDFVVFVNHRGNFLQYGNIVKFSKKKIYMRISESSDLQTTFPEFAVKILNR